MLQTCRLFAQAKKLLPVIPKSSRSPYSLTRLDDLPPEKCSALLSAVMQLAASIMGSALDPIVRPRDRSYHVSCQRLSGFG